MITGIEKQNYLKSQSFYTAKKIFNMIETAYKWVKISDNNISNRKVIFRV